MAYGAAALNLRIPSITHLGRVEDRVSFLFLDQCRIEQTRTGVESWQEEEGELWRTTIPAGNLSVLALGPGVSITTPALTTLHRSGTTVILTSGDGLVAYSVRPDTALQLQPQTLPAANTPSTGQRDQAGSRSLAS